MLKPGWYLPDTDWFARLPDAPQLNEYGRAVIGQLARLLSSESPVGPAVTVAATHVILLTVEHLGDTMTLAAELHDLTDVARLLCGLNLVQAHLTQTIQRIPSNADARAYPGIAETPAELLRAGFGRGNGSQMGASPGPRAERFVMINVREFGFHLAGAGG